jgi:hypothetical protein
LLLLLLVLLLHCVRPQALVTQLQQGPVAVRVIGPLGSVNMQHYLAADVLLLVAGGVGVSSMSHQVTHQLTSANVTTLIRVVEFAFGVIGASPMSHEV